MSDAPEKTTVPGAGEVLALPEFSAWADVVRQNAAGAWRAGLGLAGCDAQAVREQARREAVSTARAFSSRLGVPLDHVADTSGLIVMTGHQPELYHAGAWVKVFLAQRLARQLGAIAVDLVVDADAFEAVEARVPEMSPRPEGARHVLAAGGPDTCFACAPVPERAAVERFVADVRAGLSAVGEVRAAACFEAFAENLLGAMADARHVGELVTIARRRYEAAAGTGYLELPLSELCAGRAFSTFAVALALDAEAFRLAYNEELALYRSVNGLRSVAKPAADLRKADGAIELPLWAMSGSRRVPVWAQARGGRVLLVPEGASGVDVGGEDGGEALAASGLRLAPKALTLTLFHRLFVADGFVHGIGGAAYDRVTDGITRRYFGVEPPVFAVASLTMRLDLAGPFATEDEVASVVQRLNRVRQNPDQMLGDAKLTGDASARASELADRKSELVSAIASPGADKKSLGGEIREVNASLASLLAPLEAGLVRELETLRGRRAWTEVAEDRTYPFCFFDPREIAAIAGEDPASGTHPTG